MWRSAGILNAWLLAAVIICALSLVTSQHKARKLYVELQEQKELSHQMDVEWGQLQLEQRTFSTPAQVEKIAVQQLQMLPRSGQIRYIQTEQPLPPSLDGTAARIADGATDKTTDGTTSHSAKPPKNGGKAAGYSHLTDSAASHSTQSANNADQVPGYLPQARNKTVGPSPPGIRN